MFAADKDPSKPLNVLCGDAILPVDLLRNVVKLPAYFTTNNWPSKNARVARYSHLASRVQLLASVVASLLHSTVIVVVGVTVLCQSDCSGHCYTHRK